MIYQNILNEISPYMAGVMRLYPFGEHRHADIEIQYCIKDKIQLTVNKKSVTVKQGELILVSPMSAHSVISEEDSEGKALLVVVGVSLLKNFFSFLDFTLPENPILCEPSRFSTILSMVSNAPPQIKRMFSVLI